MNSAMISLQWANMFIMDNIPSNLFSTLAGLNMIGLAVNNAFMSNKIEEEDYTAIYGSNYALAKDDNGLTLEDARIIVQSNPNVLPSTKSWYAYYYNPYARGKTNIDAPIYYGGGKILLGYSFTCAGAPFPGLWLMQGGVNEIGVHCANHPYAWE
jgi:hypothetical protein